MTRILHFIHGLNVGGAETFIANVIATADSNLYEFGFAIQNSNITNTRIESLIKSQRINIHILPQFPKHLVSQYKALKRTIKDYNYDVIHIHANSLVNPIPLIVSAHISGINVIFHSHSSSIRQGGLLGLILHKLNRTLFIRNRFTLLACSDKAAHWMFGTRKYSIITNALNISAYNFTPRRSKLY